MTICDISVVIPTYKRPDDLVVAIEKIVACDPQPAEIVVHIDYGETVTKPVLDKLNYDSIDIVIIEGDRRVGPGGGRNKAIKKAKHNIIASFDDDSYPLDKDYFARLLSLFEKYPKAAVIGAAIYHRDETILPERHEAQWEHSFVGCGCAYRRELFLNTGGYVELPVAYGMEEVDLSLRLYDQGWRVLVSPWLRVFHDTNLARHGNPKITAASISNQILLTYLRYPVLLWWIGIGQTVSRILWLIRNNRFAGIGKGLINIPSLVFDNRQYRAVVKANSLNDFLRLKRQPIPEKIT
ncbi:glycosyltransferase family 2 protein [[Limnothrix rosea] IAM M-220]|uniref:glycosyltransferase family 2 protein n=1 Tax=[Limnothrix rosea] IAM M-220 TaxID=454133 RepID=UPI00095C3C25|nr:glycosyltransferase [[Limnothrix rosea] IAM M-220]OKH19906.1 family 2 glycosyl transferase [[Limnothrix rosea] IAM M-220]